MNSNNNNTQPLEAQQPVPQGTPQDSGVQQSASGAVAPPSGAPQSPPMPQPVPQGQGMPQRQAYPTPSYMIPPIPKAPPRAYSNPEYWLLLLSIAVGFLFDRMFLARYTDGFTHSIFWLCFIVAYYGFCWKKVKKDLVLWIVIILTTLLCIWNFIFDYRSNYGYLASVVIPAVLMAHVQYSQKNLSLRRIGAIVSAWFIGWFVQPFSGIQHFFGANRSLLKTSDESGKKKNLNRVLIGLVISVPILIIVVTLLSNADAVFAYFLKNIFKNISISSIILHLFLTIVAAFLLYSFFWNYKFGQEEKDSLLASVPTQEPKVKRNFDVVIVSVVLIMVIIVYVLFVAIQFTYLFARTGLLEGYTYSEYARQGFAQITFISALNITVFALLLYKTKDSKFLKCLLALLLVLTGIMLYSGLVRLNLYIDAYLLTWLRLLSLWFIVFLFGTLVLCAISLFKRSFPSVGVGAIALLLWFVILGYSNPEAQTMKYNLAHVENPQSWISDNRSYFIYDISDDGRLVLHSSHIVKFSEEEFLTRNNNSYYDRVYRKAQSGRSYTSHKLLEILPEPVIEEKE